MAKLSSRYVLVSIFRSGPTTEITTLGTSSRVAASLLWSLFISLFKPTFLPLLPTKLLLLYHEAFPMFRFKLLGIRYIPVSTQKSTFDNAFYNTPWCLWISIATPISFFINTWTRLITHHTWSYVDLRSEN